MAYDLRSAPNEAFAPELPTDVQSNNADEAGVPPIPSESAPEPAAPAQDVTLVHTSAIEALSEVITSTMSLPTPDLNNHGSAVPDLAQALEFNSFDEAVYNAAAAAPPLYPTSSSVAATPEAALSSPDGAPALTSDLADGADLPATSVFNFELATSSSAPEDYIAPYPEALVVESAHAIVSDMAVTVVAATPSPSSSPVPSSPLSFAAAAISSPSSSAVSKPSMTLSSNERKRDSPGDGSPPTSPRPAKVARTGHA